METGTFPQEAVEDYIEKNFVPLLYSSGTDSEQFMRFSVMATPTFVFLDSKGNEIDRVTGFYDAGDFVRQLEKVRSSSVL